MTCVSYAVRQVVDVSGGTVVAALEYDEYGNVLSSTNEGFVPFAFAGGLYDSETRFVRFGARDYAAVEGRWTRKDPIRFDGGDRNLFVFCAQDPASIVDKSGTSIELAIQLFEMAINALAVSTDPNLVKGLSIDDYIKYAKGMLLSAGVFVGAGFAVAIVSANDPTPVGQLIRGRLKRSPSYHAEFEGKTVSELKTIAKQGGDAARRAKQMLKLVNDQRRLIQRNF